MFSTIALFASLIYGNTRITLDMPPIISWQLMQTHGVATFVTSPDSLNDKNVSTSTEIMWSNIGTNRLDSMRVQANIEPQLIGVAGLMNLTLPVGTNITCRTYFSGAAIAQWNNRATLMPDGTTAIWFTPTALDLVDRVDFFIYNDISFTETLPDPVIFSIGEIWFSDSYPSPIP